MTELNPKNFLLHIGYAKAGSSLTGEWFAKNPSFHFNDFAIGGFRDTNHLIETATCNAEQPKYYVVRDMMFTIPRYDDGDFSKAKELKNYQKNICTFFSQIFPFAKVLIVTRGYESMIAANYSQHLKEGGIIKAEDILEFTNFIRDLFDYSYVINLYKEAFGEKNLIVLPYELLKDNPTAFFSKIEEELELPHFSFAPKVFNPSLGRAEASYLIRVNSLVDFVARNSGEAGKKIKAWYITMRREKSFQDIIQNQVSSGKVEDLPLLKVPEELLQILKENSNALKDYSIFCKYLSVY